MKTITTHMVKVGDDTFPVRFTTRSMIQYEELSGDSILTLGSIKAQMMFFYTTAKAGAKAEKKEFKYSFDEFLDAIDDHYADAATNFAAVLMEGSTEDVKKK